MDKKDWGRICDRLEFRLVNVEKNSSLLKEVPHRCINDLAVVYHIVLNDDDDNLFAATINNGVMEALGVTEKELYDTALANTMKVDPPVFEKLTDLMKECAGDDEMTKEIIDRSEEDSHCGLYALTNKSRMCGAGAMIYPHALELVAELMNSDLLILPSSIHEVLLMPYEEGMDLAPIQEMVREINRDVVDDKDFLSDALYVYRLNTDTIEIADVKAVQHES